MKYLDGSRIYPALLLVGAILGLGLLGYWILSPFLAAIAWALVLAVAFQGPWTFLRRRLPHSPNLAAGLLTLAIGLLVLLPAVILLGTVAGQVNQVVQDLILKLNTANVRSFHDLIQLPAITNLLDNLKDRAGMTSSSACPRCSRGSPPSSPSASSTAC